MVRPVASSLFSNLKIPEVLCKSFPLVTLVLISLRPAHTENIQTLVPAKPVEKYTYEATSGDNSPQEKESIDIEIHKNPDAITFHSKTSSPDKEEEIGIEMTARGEFITAERNTSFLSDNSVQEERIERKGDEIFLLMKTGDKTKKKKYRLQNDKIFAVDASLLLLMRTFPFSEKMSLDIFMIDFSQKAISVTLRNTGEETVTVPAGQFECYRMEVTINLFLLKSTIAYWITKEAPHFLVKHEGKRGPFTPYYKTNLVSFY